MIKHPISAEIFQPAPQEEARAAYHRVLPRSRAFASGELMAVTVDISRAVGIALAAEPRVMALLPRVKIELPRFDAEHIETLREVALAAWYVHTVVAPPAVDTKVKELVASATRLRRALLVQAKALAARRLLAGDQLAAVRKGRSNLALANSISALANIFRINWTTIAGKTPVTEEELDQANALGRELLSALDSRKGTAAGELGAGQQLAEARMRAFTLLARTYDEVRRAVEYLRWHERDAQEIAPSLYAGSRGGRKLADAHARGRET